MTDNLAAVPARTRIPARWIDPILAAVFLLACEAETLIDLHNDKSRHHWPLVANVLIIAGLSVPIAWRVLEEDPESKEWRTRLALEMIDSLPEPGLGEAVVAAGTAYGSLSGFRRGLEARGLPYLLRVDPVTAARELAPDKPNRSAAESREVVRGRIAGGAGAAVRSQSNGARGEPELVVVLGMEHLLLCEIAATGQANVFWLSNLPTLTSPQRLASACTPPR